MSIATVYRRIDSIKDHVGRPPAKDMAKLKERAAKLLALMEADTARAHNLAAARMQRQKSRKCCPECASHIREVEALRLAADLHKAVFNYLKHIGLFDHIKTSGRAAEILLKARSHMKDQTESPANENAADTT